MLNHENSFSQREEDHRLVESLIDQVSSIVGVIVEQNIIELIFVRKLGSFLLDSTLIKSLYFFILFWAL